MQTQNASVLRGTLTAWLDSSSNVQQSGALTALGSDDSANGAELFHTLVQTAHVRVERIVSQGHASEPDFWYDQAEDEFVLLLSGAARLEFEGGAPVELAAHDWVNIPAHVRHRVAWTDPDVVTLWLAVFTPVALVK